MFEKKAICEERFVEMLPGLSDITAHHPISPFAALCQSSIENATVVAHSCDRLLHECFPIIALVVCLQ